MTEATMNSEFEAILLDEFNKARTQPELIAQELSEMKDLFDGVNFSMPHENKLIRTNEGIAALNNAITFFQNADPVPALQGISDGLSKSAFDLVSDNGPLGMVGNTLSDGTSAQERWVRYGQWKGKVGENIGFTFDTPQGVALQWIIDDGNGNRPHRRTLMDEQFTLVGISHGPHSRYGSMTVADFAVEFVEGIQGHVPKVGNRASNDSSYRASANRKTQETTINQNNNDNYVIETETLDCSSKAPLKLVAKGKVLVLSHTFKQGGKTKRKNLQWQLPFAFNSEDIIAQFENQRVTIQIPKPENGISGNQSVSLGQFQLNPAGNAQKISVDVKQIGSKFVLTVGPSMYTETVVVEFKGDVITINSTHYDNNKPVALSQPLRLPFVLSSNIITTEQGLDGSIIITIVKPAAKGSEIEIPIL